MAIDMSVLNRHSLLSEMFSVSLSLSPSLFVPSTFYFFIEKCLLSVVFHRFVLPVFFSNVSNYPLTHVLLISLKDKLAGAASCVSLRPGALRVKAKGQLLLSVY